MPRANAKNHSIDVAPTADLLTLLKFIILYSAKVPAAITKNFVHFVYLFLIYLYLFCNYSIAQMMQLVNSSIEKFFVKFLTSGPGAL